MLAGLELDRALEILVGLDETKSMRPVFAALLEQVRGGSSFADALAAQTVFPPDSTSASCTPANRAATCKRRCSSSANIWAARSPYAKR
ncbi:MAG: type II secretion system F family protein [Rhizomicrobium sp.]